jgi:hypothetical protein
MGDDGTFDCVFWFIVNFLDCIYKFGLLHIRPFLIYDRVT